MHRMHPECSDSAQDPHSPVRFGVWGLVLGQLKSYEKTLAGLQRGIPDLLHALIAATLGFSAHSFLLASAYFLGIMSHPVQGGLVNAFAHWYGYRNFKTPDQSQNNLPVAILVFGEGLQNNHHQNPGSANFAIRWWEPDLGYRLCQMGLLLGLFKRVH